YFPETASANMLVYVEEFQDPYAGIRETGVSAITYPDIRWGRNEIKVTSLLANCLAAQAAREAGASESILIDATGFVTEGSHTSVFAVREGKVVVSPAAPNILPGITKRQVLSLAGQGGIELMEGKLSREDLWKVDEVFLTGTPEEILPAVIIDGRPVGGGTVGPVTRKLQQTFRASLESWLKTSVVE
ncbi:MAG: aminotransferase class IV, partial [Acidobacteriales bacterium]|nr:aminotransferase class IV [Terriglobales bacterium]